MHAMTSANRRLSTPAGRTRRLGDLTSLGVVGSPESPLLENFDEVIGAFEDVFLHERAGLVRIPLAQSGKQRGMPVTARLDLTLDPRVEPGRHLSHHGLEQEREAIGIRGLVDLAVKGMTEGCDAVAVAFGKRLCVTFINRF